MDKTEAEILDDLQQLFAELERASEGHAAMFAPETPVALPRRRTATSLSVPVIAAYAAAAW